MAEIIYSIHAQDLNDPLLRHSQYSAELESGKVIYLPQLSFKWDQPALLNPNISDTKKKNISYDYQKQKLSGISPESPSQPGLQVLMHAYADYAKMLVQTLFPEYQSALRWGRTSYRPVEILGRQRSKRQDDTRVHVDAFPSTPVQGWRILRVFCNINPNNQPRVWHLGDHFPEVLQKFAAQLPKYHRLQAKLFHLLRITKSLRSAYDHYMLHLHDQMKLSDHYQAQLQKTQMDFAAHSTWIVFTDQVSHAALSGQYLLEQTFYLPISTMVSPHLSPMKQMEQYGVLPV